MMIMRSSFFILASCQAAVLAMVLLWSLSPVGAETNLSFAEGDRVELKVNALTSTRTLLPMENYRLPFCQPVGGPKADKMNFGQLLAGDRIQTSPYLVKMKMNMYCEQLCVSMLGRADQKGVTPSRIVKAIRQGYHSNWIVDNLASASKLEDDKMVTTRYWHGFPVGFVNESNLKSYINNHVNIEIQYHASYKEKDKFRIVRFTVEPFSIKHDTSPLTTPEEPDGERFYLPRLYKIKNPIPSCDPGIGDRQHTNYNMIVDGKPQEASGNVLFTYDVVWTENRNVRWASRWDIYVTMDNAIPVKVHWVSIANSLIFVLALSGMVAVILARNVQRANDVNDDEEEGQGDDATEQVQESLSDKGYTLVHVDYFHPPDNRLFLLAVFCGTGAQVLTCFMITTIAAAFGYLHSSQRGRLIVVALFAFYACGVINGFVTVQVLKLFKTGQDWQRAGLVSSIFFPVITLALFLGQEILAHARHSTLAVPLLVILVLLALWLGVSVPLTYLGAYAGNYVDIRSASLPTTPRTILLGVASYRTIRHGDRLTKCLCVTFCLVFNLSWLAIGFLWLVRDCLVKQRLWRSDYNGVGAILVGGIVCLASIYVEAYYIMSSVWMMYYYSTYGFLLFVAVIFFWTCGVVSVLFNYVNLTLEASHSWWWQFLCSGAGGMWIAFYSIFYGMELALVSFPSVLLYVGFMAWASFALFLMGGFVGFLSSFLFVRTIFSIGMAGTTMLEHEQGIDLTGEADESRSRNDPVNNDVDPEPDSCPANTGDRAELT